MVKKELELLDGAPEFEKYTAEVRFPSNLKGDIQNSITDKIRLKNWNNVDSSTSEEEALNNIENKGELLEIIQDKILDFVLKHARDLDNDRELSRDNLTNSAVTKIMEQYSDEINGVKVGKN